MAVNRVTGMYSGLDTESIVSQLVEAKSVKVNAKKKDQMAIKYKQDAWNDLNKKVKSLFSNISNLRFQSSYSKMKTTVSDSSVASVVSSDSAMLSSQTLKVNKLAKAGYLTGAQMETADGEKATSGTLVKDIAGMADQVGKSISITVGGETKDIEITEDMTLSSLASKLSEAGVNAKFDSASQRIFISAKETGVAADFTLGGDADALNALGLGTGSTKIDGQDAEIELNGAKFTSKSNVFEINGLTITAQKETKEGESVTLNTTKDTSAIYDMVKKFITEYTSLMNEMDKLYNVKKDKAYKPLLDEEKAAMSDFEIEKWEDKLKEQALAKDSSVSDLSSAIRDVMNRGFEVNGKTLHLFDFGIEAGGYFTSADNEKNGLHIKGDKDDSLFANETNTLEYMITSDPDAVTDFFTQLSKSLYEKMDGMSAKVNGTRSYGSFFDDVKMKTDYSDYTSKIADMEEKVTAYEDKWYKKFSKMETAMAKMQSNQNAIAGLIGGR